jgi:hypothetical protein
MPPFLSDDLPNQGKSKRSTQCFAVSFMKTPSCLA